MEYNFYGNDAKVKDKYGLTPKEYYDILSNIWSKDTCAPRLQNEWSINNITKGQCSITSFLMQDLFGGDVYGIPLDDGNFHCFNVVEGIKFDLTSEQFGNKKLDYINVVLQNRETHFKKEEKKNRYLVLKERLFNELKKRNIIK